MERSPGSGGRWECSGPPAPPELTPDVAELQSRVQETLELLSPQDLRNFRLLLKTVDEEPRVSPVKLELEGRKKAGLARLVAQNYCEPAASRVLVKVLRQLRRADLLRLWQGAADRGGIPRKILKRSYDCVDGELDRYDLSGSRKAFLMCVEKSRPGAHRDIELMKEWLGQCQFEHTACIDPNKMELLRKITLFRDGLNEIKGDVGCCLITLMSHGENGFIKMEDGEKVNLQDIFEMFNNKNCPALQEKPKIFIIQACRGERRDSGVETDDEPMESDDVSEKRRLPTFSDYFIIYPTQADHVALRHPRTGSVMIEAMSEVFKQYGNKWHIADFFTRSNPLKPSNTPQVATGIRIHRDTWGLVSGSAGIPAWAECFWSSCPNQNYVLITSHLPKVNNRVVHTEFHLHEEPIKVSLVMESTLTKSVYF
uniref:Caspase-14-like n=3 Tax=Canis lupus TaxID=9612 RepID=A0A8C0TAV6_CANLF